MSLRDDTLKRTQLWIAIMAGTVTFVVGAYNAKNIFFHKKDASLTAPAPVTPNPIRSAIEDIGASWIKKWGTPKQ